MRLHIPKPDDPRFEVELNIGEIMFVVGANGSGKSALIDHLSRLSALRPVVRVRAHRQIWFDSPEIGPGPREMAQRLVSILTFDVAQNARYTNPQPNWRVDATLFAISEATHRAEHRLWEDIQRGSRVEENDPRFAEPPLEKINHLFRDARLNVQVVLDGSSYVARREGASYGANAMSDGERAAFLIAGEVLTAKEGSYVLIDEPERHLHRSIASPLLSRLFEMRRDCAFVISTHDLDLPLDNPGAKALVLRSCSLESPQAVSWDLDLLERGADLPEGVRRDILGARRNVLFVEGGNASLDKPLYAVLFPEATVVSCGGYREVEKRVKGLRDTRGKHWVTACGIVDRDFRTEEEISDLPQQGIFALGAHSVESVYYRSEFQKAAAESLAAVTGTDPGQRVAQANDKAIAALRDSADHLASRAAEARYLDHAIRVAKTMEKNELDPGPFIRETKQTLQKLLQQGQFNDIAAAFPIRESAALGAIASSLGFSSRDQYEATVVKILGERGALWGRERERFAGILGEFRVDPGVGAVARSTS